jgi:ubiquinone/menaquinone biosynthesis C-methylase UbiE
VLRFLRRKPHTQVVIDLWNSPRSRAMDYFVKAEAEAWIRCFWSEDSRFRTMFDRLDLTSVLDLACGQGRHTAQFIDRAGHVTLLDTSAIAMDVCRERFAGRSNIAYFVSPTGRDLSPIRDESLTSVFSYDAMVHFDQECVFGYLHEIRRVLQPGGRALLHVSAYDRKPGRDFRCNPDWRAHMSESAFREGVAAAGLRIEHYEKFPWSIEVVSDALALLAKAL